MDVLQPLIDQALALHRAGAHAEAEALYRQVLAQEPRHAVAWHLLGAVCHEQERNEEAIDAIGRAIALNDRDPIFHANLGEILRRERRLDDAVVSLQRALVLNPSHAEAYYKLGLVYSDLRQSEPAIACFARCVELRPQHFDAFNNWGVELSRLERVAEAIACFERSLALKPDFAYALSNLGAAYSMWERSADARPLFRRAMELDPTFYEAHSNYLFAMNYDPAESPESIYQEHCRWGARHAEPRFVARSFPNTRQPNRRLRVGFISGDWRFHPVGHFMLPVLDAHDRQQFEFVCYDDNPKPDRMTQWLRERAERWESIVGWSDDEVVSRVLADELDLIVDLSGHTTRNRLMVLARNVAPVQVSYLGYVTTTGMQAIDYRLTDAICDPPEEPRRHVEHLVHLPELFCAYFPLPSAPEVEPLPAATQGTITFGSLHNLAKLNAATLDLWANVLRAVPNARLRIVRRALDATMQGRLRAAFDQRGIDLQRIEMRPDWPEGQTHLSHYQAIDIALDVVPWSGHTTACEGLWQGVPIITRRGNRHAGRMVASVLHSLGLDDWVAETDVEFVEIARRWSSDLTGLSVLRAALRGRMSHSRLCDGPRFTRGFEAALRQMWAGWCASVSA